MNIWSKQDLHITRAIGAIDGDLPAYALLDRLVATGCPRGNGYQAISRAVKLGLLLRSGPRQAYAYRLNKEYVPAERKFATPVPRPACPHCHRAMPRPRKASAVSTKAPPKTAPVLRTTPSVQVASEPEGYVGPAFDPPSLAPHLGTPICDHDEVTPAEGMRYCEATRRIFRHAFTK